MQQTHAVQLPALKDRQRHSEASLHTCTVYFSSCEAIYTAALMRCHISTHCFRTHAPAHLHAVHLLPRGDQEAQHCTSRRVKWGWVSGIDAPPWQPWAASAPCLPALHPHAPEGSASLTCPSWQPAAPILCNPLHSALPPHQSGMPCSLPTLTRGVCLVDVSLLEARRLLRVHHRLALGNQLLRRLPALVRRDSQN